MGWINTSHRFEDRRASFILTRSQGVVDSLQCGVLDVLENYPEKLHDAIMELVLRRRPELSGCVIHWIDFRYSSQTWQIGLSHGSLPPVAPGDEAPEFPLYNEEERHRQLMAQRQAS